MTDLKSDQQCKGYNYGDFPAFTSGGRPQMLLLYLQMHQVEPLIFFKLAGTL